MNIGFFIRHFSERGTEVSVYDYALFNEEILKNKSYIICFTEKKIKEINFRNIRISYEKFKSRFLIIEINDFSEMPKIIKEYNLTHFYTQCSGGKDIYNFDNKKIWGKCKTIKHCVFELDNKEGDFYLSISHELNNYYKTNFPVLPYMVYLPKIDDNLRDELNIPKDAIVFGRHGAKYKFNLDIAHFAIKKYLEIDQNCYFLFMNTNEFLKHPRIIYLDMNLDLDYKVKFINSCDAMIHARNDGETFGLSIAEFSLRNKPIITCNCGTLEHIRLLGEKAIIYNSKYELLNIFKNIRDIIKSRSDWNSYDSYSPENVMSIFKNLILLK